MDQKRLLMAGELLVALFKDAPDRIDDCPSETLTTILGGLLHMASVISDELDERQGL